MPKKDNSSATPSSLGAILSRAGSSLAQVADRAAALERLTGEIRAALPSELQSHVHSANLRGDTLVLLTDSAVWAARLRFYVDDILKNLAPGHTSNATKLRVKVRAPSPPSSP